MLAMAVFDATILICLLDPSARVPDKPGSGANLPDANTRIYSLLESLAARRETVVIPAPVLAEALARATDDAIAESLEILDSYSCIRIVPFGRRAGIQLAKIIRDDLGGRPLGSGTIETRAKLKFDRQILAVALVENQSTIYTDDLGLSGLAARFNVRAIPIYQLPVPPTQEALPFD